MFLRFLVCRLTLGVILRVFRIMPCLVTIAGWPWSKHSRCDRRFDVSTNHVASFLAPCVLSGLSRLSWLSLDSGSGWLSLSLIRERKELRARLQQFIGGGAVNAVSAAREQELIALNEDRQQLVHLQQLVLQLMGGQQRAAVPTPPPPAGPVCGDRRARQ